MSSDDYNNYNTNNYDNNPDYDTAQQVEVGSSADDDDEVLAAVNNKVIDHDDDHDDHNHDDDDDDDDDNEDDVVKDVMMWRRSKISVVVMLGTTLVWVLLQVYGYNFVPLASWTLMAVAVLLFCYGSFLRLFSKEAPKLASWEMTEQTAKEIEESTKRVMEKGIRWMFYVSCEREWYLFLGVISSLFLLAYVGHYIDLITLLYTGTIMGMTIPVMYVKKEDVIKAYAHKVEEQSKSMYHKIYDKVFSKSKLHTKEEKED